MSYKSHLTDCVSSIRHRDIMHCPHLHGVLPILHPMVGDVLGIRVILRPFGVTLFQPSLVAVSFVTWIAHHDAQRVWGSHRTAVRSDFAKFCHNSPPLMRVRTGTRRFFRCKMSALIRCRTYMERRFCQVQG